MTTDHRDAIDFAHEPVGRLFRRMLLPTLIGMLSIVVLNLTDGAFIGHGAGSEALAGVNIAAPIFNILAAIALMFGVGCSVVASIHLSRGKRKAANINVTQALIGSVLLALVVSVLILTHLGDTCRLFGSNERLVPLASSYLRWIALAEPLITLDVVGRFLVRLDGSPRFASACAVVASGLNIVLDYLFIFPLGWGLEGAAIATSISFSLTALAQMAYLVWWPRTFRLYRLRLTRKSLWLTLRNLGYQVRMGASAMLGEMAICGSTVVGNFVFIRYLGEDGVAAYGVACYCLPVIYMMASAIVQSAQPIVSFAYGAAHGVRLRESRRLMLRWATAAGAALSLAMWWGAPLITRLFLPTSAPAYALSAAGLPYYALSILPVTLCVVLIGYMQSVEQAARATLYTLLRGFVIIVPAFLLLPPLIGTLGIWLAPAVAETLTLLIMAAAVLWRRRVQHDKGGQF